MRAGLAAGLAAASLAAARAEPDPALAARIAAYEAAARETRDGGAAWLLAESYAEAGRKAEALEVLEDLAERRMGFAPTPTSRLAAFDGDPAYDSIAARMARDLPRTLTGRFPMTLWRPGLVPEGIAWDAVRGRILVGDMAGRSILQADRSGRLAVFAEDLELRPLGMKADVERGRLWVAATDAFSDAPEPRAQLLAFDLATGARLGTWTHERARAFNDLEVASDGTVYVSDSLAGAVFRLREDRLEPLTPLGGMGFPNGLALDGGGRFLFVAQGLGLRRVDLASGEVARVPHPETLAVLGIDGLYWRGGDLLAVQNVGMPGRVLRLRLSAAQDRVEGFEVLASGDPRLDMPTTGALAGDRLLVIANAQVDRLRPDGTSDPKRPPGPVHILELPLD